MGLFSRFLLAVTTNRGSEQRTIDLADPRGFGIEAELRKLHYDTANATHPASMAALLKLVPATQVVYGSDYPYFPVDAQVDSLGKLGLGGDDLKAIQSGNAMRLVPRIKV